MRKLIIAPLAVLALTVLAALPSSAQGQRSVALGRVLQHFFVGLCTADPSFDFTPTETITLGGLILTANFDNSTGFVSGDGDDIRGLNVTVTHGATSSTHTAIYEDNDDSDTLTCADTIGAVL